MEKLITFFLLSASIAFGIYWGTHTKEVNRNLASFLTIGGLIGIVLFIIVAVLFLVLWGIANYPQDARDIAILIGGAIVYFVVVHPIITKFINTKIGAIVIRVSGKTIWYSLIVLIIIYAVAFIVIVVANKINTGRFLY